MQQTQVSIDLLVEGGLLRRLVGDSLGIHALGEVIVDHLEVGVISHLGLPQKSKSDVKERLRVYIAFS